MCCSSWGHKESEMTEQMNKNNIACEIKQCWEPVEEVSIPGGLARFFLKGGKEEFIIFFFFCFFFLFFFILPILFYF